MKRSQLTVEPRTILGKKIKNLRKQGILPANIYGKELASLAVQVPYKEFEAIYKDAGETTLIDVLVNGQTRPVLIHNVQLDHVTKVPLHADFFQVNLKEKVKTMVPVTVVGEPKAVTDKIGLLLTPLSEVEVEALPADLPEKIEVNVEHLAAIDEQITVADLTKPSGVEILTDPGQVVAKIAELVTKEAEAEAAAEAAAAEEAKAEGAEGEAQAEDEEKKEENQADSQKKDEGTAKPEPKAEEK